MDARIDPLAVLGLQLGSAHVLRNAGALVTEDVLRSLAVSQALLGTRSVAIVAHGSCGMCGLDEERFRQTLGVEGGGPPGEIGSFPDVDQHVRDQVTKVRGTSWLPHRDDVRGYVFELETSTLRPVPG